MSKRHQNGFQHDLDEDVRPSSSKRPRSEILQSSQPLLPPEHAVGIIESVHLKNFMCHSKLDFTFSEQTNFIVGRNGSGKSAILTSLIIGLGGKANTASRGTSVKSLVETGKRSAEVSIRLQNKGFDAYKHKQYGDSIVITRRLTADGSSQYKIKSCNGTLVSTKRQELTHILDHFNIQIDNPVMILNQETSRNFIQSKSPRDKYNFFMKATQLERLKVTYKKIDEERVATDRELALKEELLPDLEREVKQLEKLWRAFENLEDQRAKLKRLRAELLWAKVNEKEEVLQQTEAVCQKEGRVLSRLEEKITEMDEKVHTHEEVRKSLQDELNEALERVQEVQPTILSVRKEYTIKKDQLREKEQATARVDRDLVAKRKEAELVRGRIEELRAFDHGKQAEEKAQREAQIKDLEARKGELRSHLRMSEHHCEQVKASVDECSARLQSIKGEQRELKDNTMALSTSIQNLQASKKNSLQRFGRHVPQLLREIDSAMSKGRFKKRPKGPLGSLMKLKDQRWDLATECCLGGLLFAFLVDNDQDAKTLRQIMSKVMGADRKPSIITSSFMGTVYNYKSKAMRSSRYPNLLENLEIEDPDVTNCLIDQRSLEKIALIDTNNEARNVMMNATTIPPNCSEAFTAQGDQLFPVPDFRYYSSNKQRAELLKENVDDQIREKKAELADAERRLKELDSVCADNRAELLQSQKEARRLTTQLESLRREEVQVSSKIRELASVEEPEPTNVSMLEELLQKLVGEITGVNEELTELKEQQIELRAKLKAKAAKIREIEAGRTKLLKESNDIKTKLLEADAQLQKDKSQRESLKEEKKAIEQRQSASEQQLKAVSLQLKELTEEAVEAASERISSRRKPAAIAAEIEALESHLQVEEKRQGNKEEAAELYKSSLAKYTKIKDKAQELRSFVSLLEKAMVRRHAKYAYLCHQTANRLRVIFGSTLWQQNFIGDLEIDHEKQHLHIRVEPKQGTSGSKSRQDLKALSGGERSFSTVCFVLALWDTIECPFRIMDEFDIFMDMGKRRVSLEMILEMTRRKSQNQFVFLTPLELPAIAALRNVNIMIMPEPSRKRPAAIAAGNGDDDECQQ
ncbi:structural maintenance of chromosomes protein 6-like [Dermacentor variabilis]|uniref:structural maintenance of chromosomes protein 6-like n=1 Tax=Dermacentor variabilis TaxID=34621 RepID=UPI003F5CB816